MCRAMLFAWAVEVLVDFFPPLFKKDAIQTPVETEQPTSSPESPDESRLVTKKQKHSTAAL